jgi:hypothetical protein
VSTVRRVLVGVLAVVATSVGGALAPAGTATAAADRALQVTEISAGTPANARPDELTGARYTETEHLVSGTAELYSGPSQGPATATGQGQPFTTRILVRKPPAREFSGRVVVEPFNTSGTRDSDAAWGMIGARLVENGDAWIGVSVRHSSVDALRGGDGQRYAALSIPSNGQTWDMLTQLAQLVRADTAPNPLEGLPVDRVYMTGYSQCAIDVATYANAINPLARRRDGAPLYDGYLLMGRAGSATPLDSGDAFLPAFEIRPVGRASSPIVDVESQGDAQGFSVTGYTSAGGASVRRADADQPKDRFRLYEVPGASHAAKIPSCAHAGTTFPLRYVERAALTNLYRWAERGTPPPRAPRIATEVIDTVSTPAVDGDGNARGGLRTPFLDEALSRYEPSDAPGPLCALAGVETPLDAATLAARYPSADAYVREFTAELDRAIERRTLLRADRAAILAEAEAKAAQVLPGEAVVSGLAG